MNSVPEDDLIIIYNENARLLLYGMIFEFFKLFINKDTYFQKVKAAGYNIQKFLYTISNLKAEKYLNQF